MQGTTGNSNPLHQVVAALYPLIEPKLKWQIGELNLIKEVRFGEGNQVTVRIDLLTDDEAQKAGFKAQAEIALKALGFDPSIQLFKMLVAINGLEGVAKVILVGSGKGGVGKSTIATYLALALRDLGLKVGMMDADIHGPSQAILLANNQRPQVLDNEMLLPLTAKGIKFISTASLVPADKAIAWRGQLVSGTLLQFIRNTAWGSLDVLVIDLPPGTGEVQLTLAAELKTQGVILVTMPQEIVLGDVRRALALYREKEIPVLGQVLNMASYICDHCGQEKEIFPSSRTPLTEVPTLARLPLDPALALAADEGRDLPEGALKEIFMQLARGVGYTDQ